MTGTTGLEHGMPLTTDRLLNLSLTTRLTESGMQVYLQFVDIRAVKGVSYFRLSEHGSGGRMSWTRSWAFTLFVLVTIALTEACSNSSPAISISLSPSMPQAIDQSQTLGIRANVTNDTSGAGVTWALIGPGSLSNSTASSVTYN